MSDNLFLKQIFKLEAELLLTDSSKSFPDEAHRILTNFDPFTFRGFESVNSCMHLAQSVPQYYGPGGFGKFNLTLVNNDKFFIIVMFMDQMGTEVHDHPFHGCFTPLLGNPYEITYEYVHKMKIEDRADTGELSPVRAKIIQTNEAVKINKDSVHLLSRPNGGQFSLLIAQLLPKDNRSNHFFYYPGLRIRNRSDYSFIQRILSLIKVSTITEIEFLKLTENLELDEVFRLHQYSRYMANENAQHLVRTLIKKKYEHLWHYVESHDAYMAKLKTKVSFIL